MEILGNKLIGVIPVENKFLMVYCNRVHWLEIANLENYSDMMQLDESSFPTILVRLRDITKIKDTELTIKEIIAWDNIQ